MKMSRQSFVGISDFLVADSFLLSRWTLATIMIVAMVGKIQCGVGAATWREEHGGGTDSVGIVAIHSVDENDIGGGLERETDLAGLCS